MPSVLIEVESSVQGTTRVVVVRGEIDISSVDQVRQPLDCALAESPETVVLDLSAITFCDSSGARLVVGTHRRANEQGCHLVVVRPIGPAWRTFEICQLDRWVHFIGIDDPTPAPAPLSDIAVESFVLEPLPDPSRRDGDAGSSAGHDPTSTAV
jgi:anti-sigma B factor antagonist